MRSRRLFPALLTILYLAGCLGLIACQALVPAAFSSQSPPAPPWPGPKAETGSPAPVPPVQPAASPAITPTFFPADLPNFSPTTPPLLLGLVGWPGSLNPLTDAAPVLRELSPLLYASLLTVDPETAELRPGLARRWNYSPDGQQVFFHLPAGLKWSDGVSLTAAGLAESLQATRHPALDSFSSLAAQDEQTLVFTFAQIDCAAITSLALLPLLPAGDVTAPQPRSSGPFLVADWPENGRSLSLVRNPYYAGRRPSLARITIRFIGGEEAAVALSEGQFDALGPLPTLTYAAVANEADRAGLVDLAYPTAQVTYLAINYAPVNSPLIDSSIRQALALALDRPAILADLLAGDGQLLAGPLLPQHWAGQEELAPPAYNPQLARAILVWAGLKDTDGDGWLDRAGQRLELSIRLNGENPLDQRLGWLASSYYRDLGLFVQAEGVPFPSVVDDMFTHDFSLALFSWRTPADPDQRFYWRSTENRLGQGLNFVSYRNERVDDLLDQAVTLPGCNLPARNRLYAGFQRILAVERPVDFLLTPNSHVLAAGHLSGLQPGPFAPFTWNVADWSLQEQ